MSELKFKVIGSDLSEKGKLVLKGDISNIQSNIAFKIEDDHMVIVCYTASTYFQVKIPVFDVENPDSDWKIVEGGDLKTILSVLPADDTVIEFDGNDMGTAFVIRYGRSKVNLRTMLGTTIRPETNFVHLASVDAHSFLKSMNSILKVVKQDNTGLAGPIGCLHIYLKPEESNITLMGTNSIAIAENIYDVDEIERESVILLKGTEANLLQRNVSAGEVWQIVRTASKFGFIDQEGSITLVGITDENPLNYVAFKSATAQPGSPEGYNEILIDSGSMELALRNAAKLSFNYPSVRLYFEKDGSAKLSTHNGDIFAVNAMYDIDKDLEIGVNIEALQSLFTLWTSRIKLLLKDNPVNSILEFEVLDEEDQLIDNIFIGFASDAE